MMMMRTSLRWHSEYLSPAQCEILDSILLYRTVCNGYAQLGLRGVSVLFGSGDGGVAGASPGVGCPSQSFIATFPSDCPL